MRPTAYRLQNPMRTVRVALYFGLWMASIGQPQAQDTLLAREILNTLCSPHFAGRGYHRGGQQAAGAYIQQRFEGWGLQTLPSAPCTVRVVRYDVVELKAGKKSLKAGVDYSIPAGSGLGEGYLSGLPRNPPTHPYYADQSLHTHTYNAHIHKKASPVSTQKQQIVIEWRKGPFIGSLAGSMEQTTRIRIDPNRLPKNARRLRWEIRGGIDTSLPYNIQGMIRGSQFPDSIILLCAHYDHLGMLGQRCLYPGANDNASGTAMLMDLARHYAQPENRPPYSLFFVAFAAEEAGLIGSKHYVRHPPIPLHQHCLVINLDLMGGGSKGLMVVNGEEETAVTELIRTCNAHGKYLSRIDVRKNAPNSDHYPFTIKKVPAVFLYTQGDVTAYHHPDDRAEDLAWRHYSPTFQLLRDVVDQRMRIHATGKSHPPQNP